MFAETPTDDAQMPIEDLPEQHVHTADRGLVEGGKHSPILSCATRTVAHFTAGHPNVEPVPIHRLPLEILATVFSFALMVPMNGVRYSNYATLA